MNKVKNLQEIKSNQQSKYDEIIEYLSQDNGYWLENDRWDYRKDFFIDGKVRSSCFIDFSTATNEILKNEIKYYIIYSYKNKFITKSNLPIYS